MCEFLARCERPKILEIGVDRGQTTIPLMFWLSHNKPQHHFTAVDIRLDPSLEVILKYSRILGSPFLTFHVRNSLELLKELPADEKFDLVLVDGDHNYHTVSQELELLKSHVHYGTLIIVDDYSGRWAERDLFYSERDTHQNIDIATKPVETEKHGVRPAVDEFLAANPQWEKAILMQGEPVVLYMKDPNAD